jgi:serine/threonine protein kinase
MVRPKGLESKFHSVSDDLFSVLKSLLTFNPKKRYSVEKVLKSPYFDSIRMPNLERNAPFEVFLGIDQISENEIMTRGLMRQILIKESRN